MILEAICKMKFMLGLIYSIANISGGILLGLTLLDKWDGDNDFFNKIANKLAPFQTIIGGVLVGFSILFLLRPGGLLSETTSLIGGFLLLTHTLSKAPMFKDALLKLSDKLMPFKAGIGIALMVLGILSFF